MQAKMLLAIPKTPLSLHGPHVNCSGGLELSLLFSFSTIILPVYRRYRKSIATITYEQKRLICMRERMSLNTVVLPIFIKLSRHGTPVTTRIAAIGTDVRVWILGRSISFSKSKLSF